MAKIKKANTKYRSFAKRYVLRTSKFGAPVGAVAVLLVTISSLFLPKDEFQKAKERVIKNPVDIQARLTLAEEFLKNNDLSQTQTELLLAQQYIQQLTINHQQSSSILGQNSKTDDLWSKWRDQNPIEISNQIKKWEKIVSQIPTYRDGYLQLAFYYSKLSNQVKVEENLNKALKLDPNYKLTI